MYDAHGAPVHAISRLRPEGQVLRPVRRVLMMAAAGGFLLLGMAGAAVIGAVEASAATACPPPPNPAPGQALKNIDTSLGCDNPSGAASNPATGWIAITMPGGPFGGVNQAFLQDFFLAAGGASYDGQYTETFANCSGGTATTGTYGVPGGGTLSLWTTSVPGGTMSCQYSVAYVGTPPIGATTLQNTAQFGFAGNPQVVALSAVVQTFAAAIVPEVPLAALLPVAGVLVLVVFLGLRRRRTRTRPPVVIQ